MFWVIQFYRLTQLIFFQHHLRALSAKEANHLQTTDTIKRHQRYSIHYHCVWPSLGIWGSDTHNGPPALPGPFLRACGLHNMMFRVILCVFENNGYIREYKRNSCLMGRPVWSGGLSLDRWGLSAFNEENIDWKMKTDPRWGRLQETCCCTKKGGHLQMAAKILLETRCQQSFLRNMKGC